MQDQEINALSVTDILFMNPSGTGGQEMYSDATGTIQTVPFTGGATGTTVNILEIEDLFFVEPDGVTVGDEISSSSGTLTTQAMGSTQKSGPCVSSMCVKNELLVFDAGSTTTGNMMDCNASGAMETVPFSFGLPAYNTTTTIPTYSCQYIKMSLQCTAWVGTQSTVTPTTNSGQVWNVTMYQNMLQFEWSVGNGGAAVNPGQTTTVTLDVTMWDLGNKIYNSAVIPFTVTIPPTQCTRTGGSLSTGMSFTPYMTAGVPCSVVPGFTARPYVSGYTFTSTTFACSDGVTFGTYVSTGTGGLSYTFNFTPAKPGMICFIFENVLAGTNTYCASAAFNVGYPYTICPFISGVVNTVEANHQYNTTTDFIVLTFTQPVYNGSTTNKITVDENGGTLPNPSYLIPIVAVQTGYTIASTDGSVPTCFFVIPAWKPYNQTAAKLNMRVTYCYMGPGATQLFHASGPANGWVTEVP